MDVSTVTTMTGIKKYKEFETEKTRGKKRYIERLVADEEAKEEIEEFLHEQKEDVIENRTDIRRVN